MPQFQHAPIAPKRSGLSRLVVLLGIFLVLLYLYLNLTRPPLPVGGGESAGIRSVFSIYGWGRERLDSPNSIAVGPNGDLYVSDTGNHRIAVFDDNGDFRFAIGGKADKVENQPKKGPLLFPLGLDVSPSGDIYVASMERSLVLVYNRRGKLKREISVEKPIAVTIDDDQLFVSTPGTIEVLSLAGEKLRQWGSQGRALGSFQYPNGLAHDEKGNLFVSDTQNSRIQILNPQGEIIGSTGKPPENLNDADRMFGLNMGLAFDAEQRVLVVDAFRHTVHVFDYDGNRLGELGEKGELEGQFSYPSDITSIGGGKFAVADKWNDRIQVVRVVLPESVESTIRAQSIYPYVLLVLLLLGLVFLSWRRWRLDRALRA